MTVIDPLVLKNQVHFGINESPFADLQKNNEFYDTSHN